MLNRKNRLQASEVQNIKKTAQPSRFSNFLVYFNISDNFLDKHACVVSKKIGGNAISRNKIRRQVYNAIRQEKFKPGKYVWVCRNQNKNRVSEIPQIARELSRKHVQ